MSCPNEPPCGHTSYAHDLSAAELDLDVALGELDEADVIDLDAPPPRCHMLGCSCGDLEAVVMAPPPRRVA
jgi:hypothetical protein